MILPENAQILHKMCPKIFSQILGGHVLPLPPSPMPMFYVQPGTSDLRPHLTLLLLGLTQNSYVVTVGRLT